MKNLSKLGKIKSQISTEKKEDGKKKININNNNCIWVNEMGVD